MADDLENLNDEAVLLLYLADELPAGRRSQVEHRIATDSGFAAMLGSLRQLDGEVSQLIRADAGAPGTELAHQMMVRRVVREMNKRHLELIARPAAVAAPRRRVYPGWVYPLAATAAAVFVFLGLWGFGVIDYNPVVPPIDEEYVDRGDPVEEELASALEVPPPSWGGLDEAEYHLAEIREDAEQLETRLDWQL